MTIQPDHYDLRLCGNCGTELGQFETGSFCFDCQKAQRLNTSRPTAEPCRCGDSYCSDTFGRATQGQDRSACCQYCGFYDCDVCGWVDPARITADPNEVPW